MSITIADALLVTELARASAPVEFRASDGRILGTFTPASMHGAEPHISEEELRQCEDVTTGTWYTAAEVGAKLRDLRCSR
ncbi:hypothetical protein J8F10_25345 [Gemmata sp. G18]|uniref:Uncharacterized protein n=1 Tax=Gemmata palustris TaxID=2822762 RepID=A0ABS5C0C2_9BACT|nr:hypothetical protein [Gemmata palustris]MBP3958588.1 hypothetical protein [Gemmata palustris]